MKKRQPMTAPDLVDAVTDMLYAAEETARRVAALGEAEEAARWTGYAKRARALLARLRAG